MRTLNLIRGVARFAAAGALIATAGVPGLHAQDSRAEMSAPRTLLIDGAFLEHMREQADPAILREARLAADKVVKSPLLSIMESRTAAAGEDPHDYLSLAPYWWPNPATPNHLPDIRRDGEHNPEAAALRDHNNLQKMEADVHLLALAYFLTRDERYAARAEQQVRTWFLDPATRMNPNLQHAQEIRGVNDGRGAGIIDAEGLADVVDALTLLSHAPGWSAADESGMHAWFEAYFDWLTTSKNGRAESATKNNHGNWYDQQAVAIAIYLGKTEYARDVVEAAKTKRIASQIRPDGEEPLEEARTRSFHYSIFSLEALMRLALEAQTLGVDLWDAKTADSGSIRGALDFLLPYAEKQKTWTHQELGGVTMAELSGPLLMAAVHYRSAEYEAAGASAAPHNLNTLLLEREYADLTKAGR